jgi:UDP-N-acetylmuramoyl-tripeptide--D-alanyl-D-alanine ligase
MRELGTHSDALHADLASSVQDAKVDRLILVGDETRPLEHALNGAVAITRVSDADQAADALERLLRPGDAVLVKASNSVGLARVVERLREGVACSTS